MTKELKPSSNNIKKIGQVNIHIILYHWYSLYNYINLDGPMVIESCEHWVVILYFKHARSHVTNWVDHSQKMIMKQNACQNGTAPRVGRLLVSRYPMRWPFQYFSGLLNDTIANRGEKYVQPCGYEDLNQGRGQSFAQIWYEPYRMTSTRHGNGATKCNLWRARRLGNFQLWKPNRTIQSKSLFKKQLDINCTISLPTDHLTNLLNDITHFGYRFGP